MPPALPNMGYYRRCSIHCFMMLHPEDDIIRVHTVVNQKKSYVTATAYSRACH